MRETGRCVGHHSTAGDRRILAGHPHDNLRRGDVADSNGRYAVIEKHDSAGLVDDMRHDAAALRTREPEHR